jgi:post-segregation antitoxin (ccd killing protein)
MPNITVYISKQVADALKRVKINKSQVANKALANAVKRVEK